jgi:hypothetical protein
VSPNYAGAYVDGWTCPSIDLSRYAGQTVKLAFHVVDVDGNGSQPGWYVDDISLVTGTPVFNNPEGWENGIGDWYAETGIWQVGVPKSGPGAAHSGTNCAATVLNGNYNDGTSSRLISPAFTIPPASSSPYLRFWQWYSFANSDYGVVEIRIGTNAWQQISSHFSGSSAGWFHSPPIDLTSFGGDTVQLAFEVVDVDGNASQPGWYVDDIGIYINSCLAILTQPASQTNAVGTTATFNVSASGDQPISYQWRFNSNPIGGATNTMLLLTNVQLSQSGYYDVVVTNSSCAVTSTPAQLSVVIAFTGVVIDDPGEYGHLTNSSGVYTVMGQGEGTDGTADIIYLAYQPLIGDCEITARLRSMNGGDPRLAQAGVMMRETLDPGSRQASLWVNASTYMSFNRRLTNNDISIQNGFLGTNYLQGTNYVWLRLMRMGTNFVAHYSTDGMNWQYMWFTTVNMSNQVQVGLAVTAHHYGETNTATFDQVYIGNLTPLSGTWPLPESKILLGGERWTSAEYQRVGGFKFLVGGVVGDQYSIKCSTNVAASLGSWQSLGSVTNSYGVVPFIDPQALTNRMRFYRAQRTGP